MANIIEQDDLGLHSGTAMKVRLEVSHDKANVKRVVLTRDAVIGRAPDCNLRIAAGQVSRRHCTMLVSDRGVFVRDHGSANGTYVAGQRIEADVDVPIPPGTDLNIGGVRFHVQYEQTDAPSVPDEDSTVQRTAPAGTGDRPATSPSESAAESGVVEAELLETDDGTSATPEPSPPAAEEHAFGTTLEGDFSEDDAVPVFDFLDDEIEEAEPEEPTVDLPVGELADLEAEPSGIGFPVADASSDPADAVEVVEEEPADPIDADAPTIDVEAADEGPIDATVDLGSDPPGEASPDQFGFGDDEDVEDPEDIGDFLKSLDD